MKMPRVKFFSKILQSRLNALHKPFKLTFVITKECHSRCQNCLIWQVKPKGELTLTEIELIAKKNRNFSWIHFIGGEPTDRADFPEIVRAFAEYSRDLFAINFPTNGLKPKRIFEQAKQIAELKIPKFGVTVSIDGPPEVNDALRGIPKDFDKAVETLALLREIPGVESLAGMTLYPENSHLIEETIQAIRSKLPDFKPSSLHVNLPHVSEHYYGNDGKPPVPADELIKHLTELRAKRGFPKSSVELIDALYLARSSEYLTSKRSPLPCSALASSLYLSEIGEVFPCSIWNNPLGNIRDFDYSIDAILAREETIQTRERIKTLDCPNCWTPCEAYQSLLASESVTNVIRGCLR